jgi:tRNA (guanine-N7-)-methyltransferase
MNKPPEHAQAPESLIYRPPSILERLRPAEFFREPQRLEVELGSGDGSFIIQYARNHPDRNIIAVERLLGRLRKIDRKGRRAGLANLRAIRIEAAYLVEFLLPPESVSAFHIYFPDPWPKRKHRRKRLVNEQFPGIAHRALQADGTIYLRTDDADYFAQMKRVFGENPGFIEVETPGELAEIITDFERDFTARGIVTRRCAYRKVF